ncbi:prepilin-type N-terminal cleavage/methylation domain-containing protein [Aeromonas caviae]|uniref:pilin n=1 Tax=Aeromonas caviae TaxID=648 RepID=UPI0038D1FD0C
MKRQSGFTLIELMIVVAIVAILAAIALPAYQTYTKKSKMTQLVAAGGALKTAVEVCAQSYGFGDPANCDTDGTNGMPNGTGSYDKVTITFQPGVSGGDDVMITVEPKDDTVLAPLTTSNTVTLAASASVPVAWRITCDDDAINNGYCPGS